MSKLQFRLAYRTDAAGKYNATAPLEGNEDNMFVDANLSSPEHGAPLADDVIDLSEKGCLMVVADGMGGMNAGEVASDIAIKTVTEYFDAEHMAAKSFRDSRSRMNYMEDVVVAADAAIKADARVDKEHEGMGSTIIMAWLCDNEICLTWCGDSRAYLYRPGCGFWQVSKDHSYVQGLVDDGKITPDEAFDHPYGNIITRSLGDPEKKAKADSVNFEVYEGDIFMLCSDGLSGVLRDHKTYVDGQRIETENLEDIIAANRTSMTQCRDELFAAAERNDWYDNVTAILCEIVSGNPLPADKKAPVQAAPRPCSEQSSYTPQAPNPMLPNSMRSSRISIRKKSLPIIIAAVVLLIGGAGVLVWWLMQDKRPTDEKEFFEYCERRQKVEDYRAFVKKFPNSAFVPLAQNWISDYVKDSLDRVEKQKQEEEKPQLGNDEEKGKNGGKGPVVTRPQTPKIEEGLSEMLGENTDSKNDELNLAGGNNLNKAENNEEEPKKEEKKAPATNEEEAYNRCIKNVNVSLEDCLYWMEKYGDSKTRDKDHWITVLQIFTRLYNTKLDNCKTYEDYKDFLDKHDNIMRRARIKDSNPSSLDQRMRKKAEDKMKELQNGSSSSQRPESGVSSSTMSEPAKRIVKIGNR